MATDTACPWVALVGPTASGKSGIAMALAQQLPIEIISMDSALVYRGMDIGTAKPSAMEQQQVVHHLIDIRDPHESYNAADFARDASRLIRAITSRGRLPVLVGGTMLYLKALTEGLDDMPPSDPAVRRQIEQQAMLSSWPDMHAQLAHIDPTTAQRLAPQDAQRISRALEVWHISGQPLSAFFQTGQAAHAASSDAPSPLVISLEPQDRQLLHRLIEQRFDQMLDQGLLSECLRLRRLPHWQTTWPSMRCVGYRQAWEVLEVADALGLDEASLVALVGGLTTAWRAQGRPALHTVQEPLAHAVLHWRERAAAATRQLAKRQMTWLRSMPKRRVVACDAPHVLQAVMQLLPPG